ncbi:MAG: hypothetical protein AAF950_06460 [Pseudomonadota bacterium]
MSTALNMARWDVVLQIRSHLYSATAFTTATLCLVAYLLAPLHVDAKWLALLLFTDPAVIGLSFVGAFILMERGGNTLLALSTSPLTAFNYVFGKIVSFSFLGFCSGILVAVTAALGDLNYLVMMVSLVLTNALAVIVGFCLSARAQSVNGFLVRLSLALIIALLPLMAYLPDNPSALFYAFALIPSYSILTVLEVGFQVANISLTAYAVHVAYLAAWIAAGLFWAVRDYDRFMRQFGR